MASGSSRSLANNNILFYRRRKSGSGSDADFLLLNETQGLALDFTDDFFYASEGFYGSARIKDTGTPANEYNSSPTKTASSLLTYTSPSVKMTMGPSGTLRYQAHNTCRYSENVSDANWTKTGISTTTATTITEDTSTGEHRAFVGTYIAGITGAEYAFSGLFSLNNPTQRRLSLRIVSSGVVAQSFFDLSAGTITASPSGTATIEAIGGGVYRCTVFGVLNSTGFVGYANFADTSGNISYTGSTSQTMTLTKFVMRRTPSDSTYLATTTAARYALPLQWTSAGVLEGMLVEEARTNLETQSQNFDGATFWIGNSGSVSGNAALAPDGTTTAGLYTPTAGLGVKLVYSNSTANATVANATVYTLSFFIKISQGTARYVQIGFGTTFFGANTFANFDLQTGAVGTVGATATSSSISFLGNGWYRCVMTATSTGAGAEQLYVGLVGSGSATRQQSYAASVTDTIAVWGAQVEAGSFPTSYIQTFASTVTRAADNITLAGTAFPLSTTASTLFAQASRTVDNSTGSVLVVHGGAATLALSLRSGGTTMNFRIRDSVAGITSDATFGDDTGSMKVAGAAEANNANHAFNGTAGTTDTSVTMPTSLTTLLIGGGTAVIGEPWNGLIQKIMYLPRRMSNTELQTLTT